MIDYTQSCFMLAGIAMCSVAVTHLLVGCKRALHRNRSTRDQFIRWQQSVRQTLDSLDVESINLRQDRVNNPVEWSGWRRFRIVKLIPETTLAKSVYLAPVDGKAIPKYVPGQHITIRLTDQRWKKPQVRCYSLSAAPGDDCYRITVKQSTTGLKPHAKESVSRYINQKLVVGDQVDIKPPSGQFRLNLDRTYPLVFLAGGVGITPMLSMIESLSLGGSSRKALLVYGVRNRTEHLFADHLKALKQTNPNLFVLNCYSQPGPNDRFPVDYQAHGHVNVELIQQIVPTMRGVDFYLCGPPQFMESMYQGLVDCGVPDDHLFFEAFGPASLRRIAASSAGAKDGDIRSTPIESSTKVMVKFLQSEIEVPWDACHANLLEFVESHNVSIDSGCRAGNCGTCAVRLAAGQVLYPEKPAAEIADDHCLTCIARPKTPLSLDI